MLLQVVMYSRRKDKHGFNVFKSQADDDCRNITNKCRQISFCEKDAEQNICKFYTSDDVFNWEVKVYFTLKKFSIFPELKPGNLQVTYKTNNMMSLRNYIQTTQNMNFSHLFHELFSFINSFKSLQFVHGNLHVDNVFVSNECLKFYIIDYANAYIFNTNTKSPKHKRTSYIGEYDNKLQDFDFVYWDFFTMYVSLRRINSICDNNKVLQNLNDVVKTYIKSEKLLALVIQ